MLQPKQQRLRRAGRFSRNREAQQDALARQKALAADLAGVQGEGIDPRALRAEAIEWQATRGARSGRVAWQFFTDLAGRQGIAL